MKSVDRNRDASVDASHSRRRRPVCTYVAPSRPTNSEQGASSPEFSDKPVVPHGHGGLGGRLKYCLDPILGLGRALHKPGGLDLGGHALALSGCDAIAAAVVGLDLHFILGPEIDFVADENDGDAAAKMPHFLGPQTDHVREGFGTAR